MVFLPSFAKMTDNQQGSALSPHAFSRYHPHHCPFPKGRAEIRAAAPIDRLEGSIVTEMVVNHFRKIQ